MKNFTQYATATQYPQFWTEEWLQIAINELDTRHFTPEQRMRYETILAQNAVAVYNEKKAIDKAVWTTKKEAIIRVLQANKNTIEEIANFLDVPIWYVLDIKEELEGKSN